MLGYQTWAESFEVQVEMTLVQFASLGEGRKAKAAHLRLESVMRDNSCVTTQTIRINLFKCPSMPPVH